MSLSLSLDVLLAECISDRETQKKLKKIVTRAHKANRNEQRPLADEDIIAILVNAIQAEDRGLSTEEIITRVNAIVGRSLRPFDGKPIITERSPTARDLLRDQRKRSISNLKKYR